MKTIAIAALALTLAGCMSSSGYKKRFCLAGYFPVAGCYIPRWMVWV